MTPKKPKASAKLNVSRFPFSPSNIKLKKPAEYISSDVVDATRYDILCRRGLRPWGSIVLKNGNRVSWFLWRWTFHGEHFVDSYDYCSGIGVRACLENWEPKPIPPPDLRLSQVA